MKTNRLVKLYATALAVLLAGGMTASNAKADATATAPGNHKMDRKVALTCARALGIVLPTDAGGQLPPADLATLHACISQYRADLHACAQQAGISDTAQPTRAQVPAYRACENQALSQIK